MAMFADEPPPLPPSRELTDVQRAGLQNFSALGQ
jgi:hypothetical protein